jgi:hypothetical protein
MVVRGLQNYCAPGTKDMTRGGCFSFFINRRHKASTAFSTRSTGYGSAGSLAQNTAQQDGTDCNLHPLCAIAFSLAASQDDAAVSSQPAGPQVSEVKDEEEKGLQDGGVGYRKKMKRAFKAAAWIVLESLFQMST